ncbi:SHOCT domain-containing protein [Halobacteria archaeon AArc-m2/3/4]|uniref:SHOCT domain-containing protein n=1 Tax=Natronoglomus mannanivorans TaxID=2979990 RepID=A0AAP2YVK9_9EURY|nr:SHOCT domain-containing protein [Halobacteria archaeon AArc-xg1-1]MCU4973046.1 SHOCT domain-containing protein [Halobacteria archaeon AArc-m2/3/4]
MSDDPATRLRENATEIASTVVTGVWLAALLSGQSWWLGALLFGYIVVVPVVALLYGDEEDRREWWDDWWGEESEDDWWGEESTAESKTGSDTPSHDDSRATSAPESAPTAPSRNRDALETLRDRYARGDLTDDQFERKLERLLETDTLENADEWVRSGREERERREREPDSEGRVSEYGRERERKRDREYEHEYE